MPWNQINRNGRPISLHKASIQPEFNSTTVLVDDVWEYVELWLKRQSTNSEPLFYWQQAKAFYDATKILTKYSAPLTAYYSFLNAAKTLLAVKGITHNNHHGVAGSSGTNYTALGNEIINFKGAGVLYELSKYLGDSLVGTTESLKDILYNIPYIHRAYCLSFTTAVELFTPVENPIFWKQSNSAKGTLYFEITDKKYQDNRRLKIPTDFERDQAQSSEWVFRRRTRFNWLSGKTHRITNTTTLIRYHKICRKRFHYIAGDKTLWYLKRDLSSGTIDRHPLTLAFAAMHRLSELARYTPTVLAKHYNNNQNWLISEFINVAPFQFIDSIASEITGKEFMRPGRRKST